MSPGGMLTVRRYQSIALEKKYELVKEAMMLRGMSPAETLKIASELTGSQ